VTLPDPRESRAILIGVSEYTSLPGLPAVRNNVEALRGILTSPISWNLSSEHCVAIHDPKIPEELVDPILQSAEEATDTLLVYYAGHGLKGVNRGEFRLSRSTSRAGAPHTSTDYNDIREALIGSTATRRIVILDCCYAASALGVMADPAHSVAEEALVEGTYLIAAAGETQAAMSEDGSGFTVFTGELVRLIREGVPDTAKKFMDLDTVFIHLRSSLRSKARPLPHKRVRNSLGGLTLARNKQWAGWVDGFHVTESQTLKSFDNEQVPQVAASQSGNGLDGLRGGWPTATKTGSSSATPEEAAPVVQRRPGAWPLFEGAAPSATPDAGATPERRPGGWPTAAKAQSNSAASEEMASVAQKQPGTSPVSESAAPPVAPDAAATPEHRPGGWPTATKTGASSAPPEEAPPVVQQRPGAWPLSEGAALPATPETTSTPEYRRAVWPTVKQPPQKSTSTGLPTAEELWPRILEAVKERRRFAWILLSNKAKISRFDGSVIQLEFTDESSKENYRSAGVDSVLEGVIRDTLNVSWRVEVADRESVSSGERTLQKDNQSPRPGGWPTAMATRTGDSKKTTRRPGEWPEALKSKPRSEVPDGIAELQELWPRILESVKERRRFAWILLSQNAKVTRFDGKRIRLAFANDAAREHYISAGANEALEQALHETFEVSWKIDIVTGQ
jgi:hypothetical protein